MFLIKLLIITGISHVWRSRRLPQPQNATFSYVNRNTSTQPATALQVTCCIHALVFLFNLLAY